MGVVLYGCETWSLTSGTQKEDLWEGGTEKDICSLNRKLNGRFGTTAP